MLACRACRVPMTAAEGCSLCDQVRRNLVVVGEHDEDRPSLSGVGNDVVHALRGQILRVKKLLALKDNEDAECRLISLANSTSKVIESVRKLQVDGTKAVESMSFAERAEMFLTWVSDLPPAYRRSLVEKMAAFELHISAPIPAGDGSEVLS